MVRPIHRHRSVTLIELIVVMVIVAGLLALLFPALSSVRESARAASCRSNLHQLRIGVRQYMDATGESPLRDDWPVLLLPFVDEGNTWEAVRAGRDDVVRPVVYACPSHTGFNGEQPSTATLYMMVGTESGSVIDLFFSDCSTVASEDQSSDWRVGAVVDRAQANQAKQQQTGPHRGGRFQRTPWMKHRR